MGEKKKAGVLQSRHERRRSESSCNHFGKYTLIGSVVLLTTVYSGKMEITKLRANTPGACEMDTK